MRAQRKRSASMSWWDPVMKAIFARSPALRSGCWAREWQNLRIASASQFCYKEHHHREKLDAMNTRTALVPLVSGLFLLSATAQEARFFRIAGPVPTTITEVTLDGWVTWTNDPTNATFTVQTTTGLLEESNWVDWVQVPVSNAVTVHRVFDPNPPEGMALIPAGTFVMGDVLNDYPFSNELPVHGVYVS